MTTVKHLRPLGHPTWADVTTHDLAASKAFYTSVFGWDLVDGGEEYGHYHTAEVGGRAVAGVTPAMSPEQPSVWTVYLASDDAAATAKAVQAHGGTPLMEPMVIGTMGTMSYALDPTGAPFGVWQGDEHTGTEVEREPGAPCWHELITPDLARAGAFYAEVFGFTYADMPGDMTYQVVQNPSPGGDPVAGMGQPPADDPNPPHWVVYFLVADIEETVAKVRAGGGTVVVAPFDSFYGRLAILTDPEGASFHALQGPAT